MAAPTGAAISGCAYGKMVLHALKHPQDAVCGLLIGPEKNDLGRRGEVLCADAVPLLHTHMFHPQLRLGVGLVEAICEMPQSEGSASGVSAVSAGGSKQKIVGFYYSGLLTIPETAATINKEAAHIARVLRQHYPNLLVCLLDFRELANRKPVTILFMPSGSSWSRMPAEDVRCSKAALELAETAVANSTYLDLADLDDHLADPTLSPLNNFIFSDFADLIEEDARCLDTRNVAEKGKNSVAQKAAAS